MYKYFNKYCRKMTGSTEPSSAVRPVSPSKVSPPWQGKWRFVPSWKFLLQGYNHAEVSARHQCEAHQVGRDQDHDLSN